MVEEAAERKVVEAFVMNALVVDDLPAAKRVVVPLVTNSLVIDAPVAERLVVDALASVALPVEVKLVVDAFVAKSDVEEAVVTTDEVAKIFCAKRLRNLRVEEPSDPERSENGVVLPAITNLSVGVVVPIPINPREVIAKRDAPDEDATLNGSRTVEDDDCTLKA